MSIQSSGSVRLTADGVIGRSGQPVRIFNITWLNGASAGEVVIRRGTTASDPIVVQIDGSAASVTNTQNFENGLFFPNGAFHDKGTNVTAIVAEYRVEGA